MRLKDWLFWLYGNKCEYCESELKRTRFGLFCPKCGEFK